MKITTEDIINYEKLYRANFINSITGFKSASLIGSTSESGKHNLAIFNSVIHIGANPPLMGFLMRPVTVDRHTYSNIKENGFFTINHINKTIFKKSHQTSARYPVDISEFDAVGLTVEESDTLKAPYVKESHIKIGLRFIEEKQIEANSTILMIGEIVEILLFDKIIGEDGYVDIEKAESLTISGLDGYHETKRLSRLSYAKPYKEIHEI